MYALDAKLLAIWSKGFEDAVAHDHQHSARRELHRLDRIGEEFAHHTKRWARWLERLDLAPKRAPRQYRAVAGAAPPQQAVVIQNTQECGHKSPRLQILAQPRVGDRQQRMRIGIE